jgi:NADPH-dependent 2,4-dienoyl-CoA reductase/sulfur reductase-like enzyme/ferredoxin
MARMTRAVIPIAPVPAVAPSTAAEPRSGPSPGSLSSGVAVAADPAATATQFFSNYTKLQTRVPMAVWYVARVLVLVLTLALAGLLLFQPALGLQLFWGLAIPVVPALLVIAPGLWRQVCPMATMNQLPRLGGFSRALELPAPLKTAAFGIAVALFLGAVALRVPVLNHSGELVGAGVVAVLVLAFAGGYVYKGRSGWCGTFCPLAPVQRTYGQAPLIVVKNGYCNPCVGCQKSCYDFNPRAAVFSDVYDEDPRHAAQRRLFMGLLPGLILGYFLQGPAPAYGEPLHALILVGACCASAGLYGLAVAFAPPNPYRVALAFGALALSAFYWFAGPTVVRTVSGLLGQAAPELLGSLSQGVGIVLAAVLALSGIRAERRYQATQRSSQAGQRRGAATQFGSGTALKDRLARNEAAEVTDRQSGITFQVGADATLLEAIQSAGLKINFGCRAGVCGADPVAVCEGGDNLSPPGEDELATLRRLGLEGRARLACMCSVKGPVLIDRDPNSAPAPAAAVVVAQPRTDLALRAGIRRVVIVGNGVAGMGAAEALRRASASVQIEVVGNEPHPFYNRMGIGRLIYDSAGMEGLKLVPPDWPTKQKVKVWSHAVASQIDRPGKRLHLASGDVLPYDKLVLATGARSTPPDADFLSHPNAFVLRSADDAHAIRDYVHRRGARRALVVGGGVLGVEAADALHKLGLKVTLLQRADRLMNAQLDEQGAAKLSGYLESIGIQVVTSTSVVRYEGKPQLQAAWLSHGPRVRADVFVAALGIQANTFLAEQAGLALGDNGVRVDRHLCTSDPDIYAIGDVADLKGTPRGLWPIGAAHASTAVDAMMGEAMPYATPRIVLQLKCEGIDLRSQGDITPREGDEDFHARSEDAAWWRLIVRSGQLAGGLYVGPPGTAKAFTKLLQQPMDLGPVRAELRSGNLEGLKALTRG